MKKLIDLSEDCVKMLSKRAIDENTNFKLLAQDILEKAATQAWLVAPSSSRMKAGRAKKQTK